MSLLARTVTAVAPPDQTARAAARGRLDRMTLLVACLRASLGGGVALAQPEEPEEPEMTLEPDDTSKPAEVDAARQEIEAASKRLGDVDDLLSRSLGFGEATLVHLDVSKVRAEVTQATSVLSSVDTGPIRSASWP